MDNDYSETCYQALYLINERLGCEWEPIYWNNGQRSVLMAAEQRGGFDEVVVLVDDILVDGNHNKRHNRKSYQWDELPVEYARMINQWYHVRNGDVVSHLNNYENIASYADTIKSLVRSDLDLEIGPYGEITMTVPLRDQLTGCSRDVVVSNDGNGFGSNCQTRHCNNI